jgi:iron complex transport system permease protein
MTAALRSPAMSPANPQAATAVWVPSAASLDGVRRTHHRISRRGRLALLVLAVLVAVTFSLSLSLGDYPISVFRVLPMAFGYGDPAGVFVVQNLRLPRAVLALLVGLAFGMSGAVFQSLARNPLASPDILGVTAGGSMVAVFGLTVLGASGLALSGYATTGALLTALLIYVLGYRRGLSSYRLVLVGLGVGAVAAAMTQYLWAMALYHDAASVAVWLSGSLNGRGWESITPLTILLAVFVPATLVLRKQLNALELGDDSASAIGVRVQYARALLLLVGVGLAGAGVGAAGPVAFVAFVSAPIARRLAHSPGPALLASGLFGSLLVLVSDLLGRLALQDTEIPVGVVTGILGAPYLLWLLVMTNRAGQGD